MVEKEAPKEACYDCERANNNNIAPDTIKRLPFDAINGLLRCYGAYGDSGSAYEGIDGCQACELRLPCARASAGDN